MADSKRISTLQQRLEQLAKYIDEVRSKLGLLKTEIDGTSKSVDGLNSSTKQTATNLKNLTRATKEQQAAQNRTNKATSAASMLTNIFGGSLLKTVGRLFRITVALEIVKLAINAIKEVTIGAVKRFSEFDRALANLAAVGGEEARKSLNELEQQAFDVAGTTRFTAKEIVGLQTELIKLGFTAEETAKLTKPVSETAQALGVDLADAALVVGQTINAFGLLAEQGEYVGDVLLTALNKSALSFETFSTAIQYIGPLAQNAGLSFEQVASAMGVLSDAGFKASRIGTGLRGVLIELGEKGGELIPTIEELANRNISLSEAVDLVGKTNAAQLLTLIRNVDELKNASEKYYEVGAASAAARIQIDTFSGATDILSSSWDAFLTRVGKFILDSPTIMNVLKDLIGILDEGAESQLRATEFFQLIPPQFVDRYNQLAKESTNSAAAVNKLKNEVRAYYMTERTEAQKRGDFDLARRLDEELEKMLDLYDESRIALIRNAKEERKAYVESIFMMEGKLNAEKQYGEAIEELSKKQQKKQAIDIEYADEVGKRVQDRINELTDSLETYGEGQENQKLKVESEIQQLREYQNTLSRVISTEKDRNIERKKAIDKLNKEELDYMKELIARNKENIERRREELFVEFELAKSKGDLATAGRILLQIYDEEQKAYEFVNAEIDKSTRLTKAQKEELHELSLAFVGNNKKIIEFGNTVKDVFEENFLEGGDVTTALFVAIQSIEQFLDTLGLVGEQREKTKGLLMEILFGDKRTAKATSTELTKFEQFIKGVIESIPELVDAALESLDYLNDEQFDAIKRRLEAQKNSIDELYQYETNILKSQLDNRLITQEEYQSRLGDIQKKKVDEQNKVEKALFEAEKKRDLNSARLELAETLASIVLQNYKNFDSITASTVSAISAAIALGQYSIKSSAINKRQFFPVKYAEGGLVNGPSHQQGGVPFSVGGYGGYEMEGGEFIVNKEATKRYRGILEKLNSAYKPNYTMGTQKFAQGGFVDPAVMQEESVGLLRAIAEATVGTAINTAKPVRAFVTTKDLKRDEVERRIKERNTNL